MELANSNHDEEGSRGRGVRTGARGALAWSGAFLHAPVGVICWTRTTRIQAGSCFEVPILNAREEGTER